MEMPVVSVIMITYNHEKYIQQAIEGVFLQKTNFPVELIIANDSSLDKTDEVILQLIADSPSNFIVKYTNHEKNKGMMPNFIWAMAEASGKYIALCEGDDYWTDVNKLQRQVEFLEKNEDFVLCFHSADKYTQATGQFSHSTQLEKREYTGEEFLRNWLIPTASVVFRRKSFTAETRNRLLHPNYIFGDIILFLSVANQGKVYCLNEIMCVYRVHDNSMMRTLGKEDNPKIKFINHHKHMAKDFDSKYRKINYLIIADTYYSFFINEKQKSKQATYFFKYNFLVLKHSRKTFFSRGNLKTFFYHLFYKPFYV